MKWGTCCFVDLQNGAFFALKLISVISTYQPKKFAMTTEQESEMRVGKGTQGFVS